MTRLCRPHGSRSLFVACTLALAMSAQRARADGPVDCPTASEQGQRLRDDAKYLRAREMFRQCSQATCPSIVRKDCSKWLLQLEDSMPSVVLSARDIDGRDIADVRVSIDGEVVLSKLDGKALSVDPGAHTFRFETLTGPSSASIERQLIVEVGEKNRLIKVVFAPQDTPAAPPPSTAPAPTTSDVPAETEPAAPPRAAWRLPTEIALGAVAVLGGASFAFFGATGQSDLNHLKSTCAPYCLESDLDAAKTKMTIADVSLVIGVVALGAAAFVLFTSPKSPAPHMTRAMP